MDVPASQDSGCLTGFFGRSSEVSSIVKSSAIKKKIQKYQRVVEVSKEMGR